MDLLPVTFPQGYGMPDDSAGLKNITTWGGNIIYDNATRYSSCSIQHSAFSGRRVTSRVQASRPPLRSPILPTLLFSPSLFPALLSLLAFPLSLLSFLRSPLRSSPPLLLYSAASLHECSWSLANFAML